MDGRLTNDIFQGNALTEQEDDIIRLNEYELFMANIDDPIQNQFRLKKSSSGVLQMKRKSRVLPGGSEFMFVKGRASKVAPF